jgi:hypothetical protein
MKRMKELMSIFISLEQCERAQPYQIKIFTVNQILFFSHSIKRDVRGNI